MEKQPVAATTTRTIWRRGLLMLVLALAYQLASTVLLFVAVIQFVVALVAGAPNPRLQLFGSSLGRYQGQIASFTTFASEELPFPFSDWPPGA